MSRQTPSLSFEVFPPNPAVGNDNIISALQDMRELTPHFISVTASNNKFNIKETTVRLADFIQNDLAIPTIAHLPAIYLTKDKVAETISNLDKVGVQKIFAVASGLRFATKGSSSKAIIGNKSFNEYIKIPWNNRYNAILGGAAYIGYNYILRGQNTPYLEKFNFTDKHTFSHQYMSAIFSPSSESLITKKAYIELKDEPLVFSIPVFQNMPTELSEKPVDILSPNNWLNSLKVTGYLLTPAFRPDTTEGYSLIVGRDVNTIELTGKTANKNAIVKGLGQINLVPGVVNEVNIEVTAEDGSVRVYKINVAKEG